MYTFIFAEIPILSIFFLGDVIMPYQNSQSKQQIQQILQECRYMQIPAAKADATNVMSHYSDLKPNRELFSFNNGTQKYLLCLSGTIPVSYRGTVYNIPVAMYLLDNHPVAAPYCYVKPTATMQVRPGRNVDANGRIYLPYLSEWKQHSHDLTGLVQIMSVVFSEQPPVVSTSASTSYQGPNPPYPVAAHGYPRGPPSTNYQPTNLPYPSPNQSHLPYPTAQQMNYPGNTPYPRATHNQTLTPYPPNMSSQQQIPDDMMKASLKSAVNDKLKRRMKDACSQANTELSTLKQTENDLRGRQEKLKDIVSKLEKELVLVDSNIDILCEKNKEMENKINEAQGKQEELDVDEVVFPATPLYKQILESFAEEQAIEDTIFYLGEALRKGSVDLESFLKHVRSLSRQQFILASTIKKARSTAHLTNI